MNIDHRLFKRDGERPCSIAARIDEREFKIETTDSGKFVEEMWGFEDYEFWTAVPKSAWGDLLAALAKEFLANDPDATQRFREICENHGVDHKNDTWLSGRIKTAE